MISIYDIYICLYALVWTTPPATMVPHLAEVARARPQLAVLIC